jgi:hypothetical protein
VNILPAGVVAVATTLEQSVDDAHVRSIASPLRIDV